MNWHITSDGWAQCEHCLRQVKGATPEITEKTIRAHLFEKHHIVELDDTPEPDVPYYIPADRNGLAPTQPKRFDDDRNMPSEKKYFKGGF